MKILMSVLLLSLFFFKVNAQTLTVVGSVSFKNKSNQTYATISIVQANNNKILKATINDSLGYFKISLLTKGNFKIVVNLGGYEPYTSSVFTLDSLNSSIDLGALTLKTKVNNDVVVTAKKKLIEIQADKTVLNIENSILAVGNSAFDLIKKAPAVTIDKDENLKLKGSVATIFIDGKSFFLTGEQLTQYLKNLPGDAISKIEVIGNPSSKYDAAGLTGIINIKLKKNKQFGTNGSITAGAGYGRYAKANSSLALNHRTKALNIFGNGNVGFSESFNRLTYNSIINNAGTNTFQDRDNYWNPKTVWSGFKIGADYNINKTTVIGLVIKGDSDNQEAITDNTTTFSNQNRQTTKSIINTKDDKKISNNISFNINFKKELDSLGSEIILDADYLTFNRKAENTNFNSFYDANKNKIRNDYTFRNGSPANINIATIKVDYNKVFNSRLKIESGAKYSTVNNDNFLKVDSISPTNNWIIDNFRTNTFLYSEKIAAAYFNITKTWKKVSLQVGLRAENTNYTGNSVTLNLKKDSSYTNLFPSAFLTYNQNENNVWNISFSRRINRPSYQSLNPFIDFIDPFTQFEGNPNLKPSFTQSVEAKHGFKNFLYSTLSFSTTKASTTNVILQNKNTGAVRNIIANVGDASYWGLNFSATVEPTKWWSIDNNLGASTGKSKSTYPEFEFNQTFFGVDASSAHSFTLPKKFKVLTSFYWSSPYNDGLAKVKANYQIDLGLQKVLWSGKGNFKINFNNIIGPSSYRSTIISNNLNIAWKNQWEGKRINFSLSYKFGNKNVKASRQRTNASQEEKNRVNL